MNATKFTVLIDDDKHVVKKPKFNIVSAPSRNKTVSLNAPEFLSYTCIPPNNSSPNASGLSISIHELGKQLLNAAANGNADDLKTLLSKGAPFTADWLGTSPLHLSAQNNHLEVTEMLLRAGISKDARTKVDRTPLHMAAYEGNIDIVDTLIKHSAEVDCRDLLGMTPLHWAIQNVHKEVVDFLISKGANLTIANKFDLTPLDIAKQVSHINPDIETSLYNAMIATQNLVIQLANDENGSNQDQSNPVLTTGNVAVADADEPTPIIIPLEPHLINQFHPHIEEMESQDIDGVDLAFEERDSNSASNLEEPQIEGQEDPLVHSITINPENFSDSLKLLQEHGITLQNENDDSNILNTVMESGHSVVLTDVGKEVLNSVKESEQQQQQKEKVFTITPDGFLKMTNEPVQKPVKMKRIMMKKNKCTPLPTVVNVINENRSHINVANVSTNNMECIMKELIEARQTIEDYKIKLHRKEQEAERYKMQLKLFMDSS